MGVKKYDEAEHLLKEVINWCESNPECDEREYIDSLYNLYALYEITERIEEAIKVLVKGVNCVKGKDKFESDYQLFTQTLGRLYSERQAS